MSDIDLTDARNFITDLILQGGKILEKYFKSGNFTSKSKGGVDFLTEADQEADNFFLERIKKQYPDCPILTEESTPEDYSSLKDTNNLWIIDPLDGTVNFSRGNPHFAISVGLVDRGISKLGVVYAPIENKLYYAQSDLDQAFFNGKPMQISHVTDLNETILNCDWSWKMEQRLTMVEWLGKVATSVRQIKSLGSAVLDLASTAEGKIDAFLHSGLKPWDVAASSLFAEKAGGKITTPKGDAWNVFIPEMLVANEILHKKIMALIN